MLKKLGAHATLTSSKEDLARASKIILPGVGAFDRGMQNLANLDLIETLNRKVQDEKVPLLGICLGAQLLAKSSEEGSLPGLGWFDAEVVRFKFDTQRSLKIPHMGWNKANLRKKSKIIVPVDEREVMRYYFIHSYYLSARNDEDVLCDTQYGVSFASGLERSNLFGVQFHPEKSHKFGMRLFKCFIEISGTSE